MTQERFTVVALPYSRDDDSEFHVSLFISPRLIPTGAGEMLEAFETFLDWTNHLTSASFELRNQSGLIEAEPLLGELDPAAWSAIFPSDTPVRNPEAPDWSNRYWRTFRAAEVHDTAKLISAVAMAANPTIPGVPDRQKDPLVAAVDSHIELPDDLSEYDERINTAIQDRRIGEPSISGRTVSLEQVEEGLSGARGLDKAFLELHRARRFYDRPESTVAHRERPIAGAVRPPLPRPEPDFHERVSLLGDHPGILRKLGLVIDLKVVDLSLLAMSDWLSASVVLDTGLSSMTTRTRCEVVDEDMVTVGDTDQWVAGMLCVGDTGRFAVLDMDADGAALKTDQFMWTLPRLLAITPSTVASSGPGETALLTVGPRKAPKQEGTGPDVNTATPAHRTGGFTIAKRLRALETQDRMAAQSQIGQAILNGFDPLLSSEDVIQGYRLEVYDDTAGEWFTLHARVVDADVVNHGLVLSGVSDEGFVQTTTASETSDVVDSPIHVHEGMFSWGGWSLSAPRPGKRIRRATPEELEADPETDEIVEETKADPDPITPIVFHTEAEQGSLPRLRYGRSYAFRVWAVDLAGNSRPHSLGPPPPVSPSVASLVANLVSGPTSPSAIAGLETDLRSVAAASVIRRRSEASDTAEPARVSVEEIAADGAVGSEVLSRLAARRTEPLTRMGRAERIAAVDRASLVGRAFEELILDTDTPLIVEPGRIDPGVIAGGIDPLPELAERESQCVTALKPFLRWEPVQPPTVVSRHANSAGESLLQLVIRSGVSQDPDTLDVIVTPPTDYASSHATYRVTSERHFLPPKTSQSEAELHGSFDKAIGSTRASDHKRLLAVAMRESGTLFDLTVPKLTDPQQHLNQPGVSLVIDAPVPHAEPKTLPLAPGEPPAPGQYVIHDTNRVRVPYLPDPAARGISLVFPDAGRDRQLVFPFGTEGFTAVYGGTWPDTTSFRIVLEDADDLIGSLDNHVLRMGLPPGDVQRFRLSSSLGRDDLDLFGFWRSLPEAIRTSDVVAEAVADGWLWMFTPADDVTLVHAVPRPLEAPHTTALKAVRPKASTDAALTGSVEVHGPSTEMITAEATWDEYTDDLTLPVPEVTDMDGVGFTSVIRPEEDLAILAASLPADAPITIPGFGPVWLHRAVHQWGDTKHRNVTYRFRSATRYREYFETESLAPDTVNGVDGDDGQSVVGRSVAVSVPSSAVPAAPIIHSVIPLMRWDVGTEPEQPVAVRRSRRPGVRIYLNRPWYSSGEGELLAVLLAPFGADSGMEAVVSQWGADPIWRSREVASRGMFVGFDNMIRAAGLTDRPNDARPTAPPVSMPYAVVKGAPMVTVLGYRPQYNEERQLWYVDVAIDPGDKFWPFVRLSVARYQPDSIDGCHLSKPVKCDFVQLMPERTASVSRTDVRHVRVVVSGPIGTRGGSEEEPFPPPRTSAPESIRRNRRVVARLQKLDPNVPTDLGWDTIDTVELDVRGIGKTDAEAAWVGELAASEDIPLAKPGSQSEWRVTIEEWEQLLGDRADLGKRGEREWERRLVYADEIIL
ncbi:MAG: hypothetical protein ABFR95_05445 [Actinomycetota bacterium]